MPFGRVLVISLAVLFAALFAAAPRDAGAGLIVYVVNSTGDTADATPGDYICSDAGGACTLRAAIEEANENANTDYINFAIGTGAATITPPAGGLPLIRSTVVIDARTQPGYVDAPLIRIDGANAGPGVHGLRFSGADPSATYSEVRGLAVTNFTGDGFHIGDGAYAITLTHNYAGLAPNGTAAGNGGAGIRFDDIDGGASTIEHNTIGANGGAGIHLTGGTGGVHRIAGNRIGTNPAGTAARANAGSGILVAGVGTTVDIGANLAFQGKIGRAHV